MLRLSLELPTVLQVEAGSAILFHEGGISQFRHLNMIEPYVDLKSSSGGLGSIDANDSLTEPASIFRRKTPFFVVEAASSRPKCFEWARKMNSRSLYMKTWSFSEVLQAYVTPPVAAHDAHVPVACS